MPNSYFQFKQFTVQQDRCAMKVTTDSCLFGAWVASEIKNGNLKAINLLDVGTGTGLLSLMLAQKIPDAKISAVEIDKETGEQANENVKSSPWNNRIKIIHADARDYRFPAKFDVIISNPPFYENELRSVDIKKNQAHHEEGLRLPELSNLIKKNLIVPGYFFLLLPYKRSKELKTVFSDQQLKISKILLVRQSVRHDFFRVMIKGTTGEQTDAEIEIEELSIIDEKDQYTNNFKRLLKDYYLHL